MKYQGKTILNLTPHDIVIYDEAGRKALATFPPSGQVARLQTYIADDADGPTMCVGEPEPLPVVSGDTMIVVSLPYALGVANPPGNMFVPHREVRNSKGQIVGCRALARVRRVSRS